MENNNKSKIQKFGQKKRISNPLRILLCALCVLVIAYAYEFVWRVMDGKGQYKTDYAWEVLAHETLSRQYQGIPEMRVTYGKPSHQLCNFWNFEAILGGCITVKIGLDVRDYRPEFRPIVEREVERLADQMRTPCRLLPRLGLLNEAELANDIGCNRSGKRFKLHFWVNHVTVTSERGPLDRPNRWSLSTVKHLYTTDFIEGEL